MALQAFSANHKDVMNCDDMMLSFSSVFQECAKQDLLNKSPDVYLRLIALLLAILEDRTTIPSCALRLVPLSLVVFHLYLEDSCSSRKWVDEKKYRVFVTKLISVFKYSISTS